MSLYGWIDCIGEGVLPGCRTYFEYHDAAKPLVVHIGQSKLIRGVEVSLLKMCVGDVRELEIPPELGYGGKQHGEVPANQVLFFQVGV